MGWDHSSFLNNLSAAIRAGAPSFYRAGIRVAVNSPARLPVDLCALAGAASAVPVFFFHMRGAPARKDGEALLEAFHYSPHQKQRGR